MAKNLGIPTPLELRRAPAAFSGADFAGKRVEVTGGRFASGVEAWLTSQGAQVCAEGKLDLAVVLDATGLDSADALQLCHRYLSPRMRRLSSHGRVIVLGLRSDACATSGQAAAQAGLTGFVRTLAKELRRKASYAHLLQLPLKAGGGLEAVLHPLRRITAPS